MKNLIQKIFPKLWENKLNVVRTLSADEIKPIFQSLGIDVETIGFPDMNMRHATSGLERYYAHFEKVKIIPVKVNENISTIIMGKYQTQAQINSTDNYGNHTPGTPSRYSFKIQEGKLNLKGRN